MIQNSKENKYVYLVSTGGIISKRDLFEASQGSERKVSRQAAVCKIEKAIIIDKL